jgi:hypothetical protein
MIRAFVFALAVALIVQVRGHDDTEAANYQLYLEQQCSANGVIVTFSWTGTSPDATEQWLDISLFNNAWQPGTFLGAGPLSASATSQVWDGLIPNTTHYVRIHQKLSNGAWDPSATYYFQTADCGSATPPAGTPPDSPLRDFLSMIGRHDGLPLGVPANFSWFGGPEIQLATPPPGWNAMLGWGQVYSDSSQPTPPPNLRIHIADMKIYGLTGGEWRVLQNVHLFSGSYYAADYGGGAVAATERPEAEGGVSVHPHAGRPYHFFPRNRVQIPPGLEGVVVTITARLTLNDPSGPDTRAEARLMLGAGLDWFAGLAGNTNTRGSCVGPMIWLTSEFKTYTCHTFKDAGVLRANPPPLS